MGVVAKFVKSIVKCIFRIHLCGEENVPSEGACVMCINHISMFDPIVTSCVIKRPIRFIGKQELFKIPVLGWYLKSIKVIPIKRGTADINAVKTSLKALKDGEILGIFPTGTRERKNPNAKPKAGAAMIAMKANVPIIPVHIKADYKPFSKALVTVGKPVDVSSFEGRKLSQEEFAEVADLIYKNIKALGDDK